MDNQNELSIKEKKEANERKRKSINEVMDYYPEAELLEVTSRDEADNTVSTGHYFLPLNIKREWFALRYPNGYIRSETIQLTDNRVHVSASVYRDLNDVVPIAYEEVFMDIDYSDNYYTSKNLKGSAVITGTINAAKAKAESNALYECGFGFQLETRSEESARVDEMTKEQLAALPLPKKQTPPPPRKTSTKINERGEIERKQVEESGQPIDFSPPLKTANTAPVKAADSLETAFIEECDLDRAKAYKCSVGGYKTLGEAAEKKPNVIVWILKNSKDAGEVAACNTILKEDKVVKSVFDRLNKQ